jgi:hypothetical protein
MGDQNLRVWPVQGDGYGDVQEFPRYAKYRMEPHYPGAAGDANHDLVVYTVDDTPERNENELARFQSTEVIVAYAGQPTPAPILDEMNQDDRDRRPAAKTAKSTDTKGGTPAKVGATSSGSK